MSYPVATPQCFIEVYPFEGGPYYINGGNGILLKAIVSRNIKQPSGSFELTLAPGGPRGTNVGPSWATVITPSSFVLIGMARGQYRTITMIGVVTNISGSDVWVPGTGVRRGTVITGQDFGYFFNSFNWAALTFLGTTFASVLEPQLGNQPGAGLALLIENLATGTPKQVGEAWYRKVMAGTEGILSNTTVPFGDRRVKFYDAVATLFEEYTGYIIPFGDYFIASEGSWDAKFRDIFPYPFYEFFVTTMPTGGISFKKETGDFTPGYHFTMKQMGPTVSASPMMVARLNPLPHIPVEIEGKNTFFKAIDTKDWNNLTLFQPEFSFIDSQITFQIDEVRNFYMINPVWFQTLFGLNNSFVGNWVFTFSGALDTASIHRYGYRPAYTETRWISDMQGQYAKQKTVDLPALVAELISRVFSYHEPTPIMARAAPSLELRPDILPGNRFQYKPLKSEAPWQFYIEGVEHTFTFGGPSKTSLNLSRGLPAAIYGDSSQDGLLTQAHLGNVFREAGVFTKGVPDGLGASLAPLDFSSTQAINDQQASIAKVYVTPQGQ